MVRFYFGDCSSKIEAKIKGWKERISDSGRLKKRIMRIQESERETKGDRGKRRDIGI